ncbi:MAG: PAS domain S-box protein [Deltaproteobacteria bacterium]|nr:PAS domain S-box protein [Deltaproteobacteria bacterium]
MKKSQISLLHKALLAILIILLPISITFFHSYNKSKENLKNYILNDLTIMAEAFEGQVYQFLEMSKRRAHDFTTDGAIISGVKRILAGDKQTVKNLNRHLIKNKLSIDDTIQHIGILSPEGKVIASTEESELGKDFSNEPFFRNGIKKISVVERSDHGAFEPGVVVSAPIKDPETGKTIGVLANFIRFFDLDKVLSGEFNREFGAVSWSKGNRKTMEVYLVNKDRLMITKSIFVKDAVLRQKVNSMPISACLEHLKEYDGFYPDYRGIMVAGASMCMPAMNWVLLVEVDEEEILAPAAEIQKDALITAGVVLGLMGVLFGAFLRGVLRPLRIMSSASEAIAGGDYNVEVPVESGDEIGKLSVSFNKMANEVKNRTALLRESEERLRAIIDNSTAIIYLKDIHGKYLLVNRRYLEIFNLSADGILGRTDYEIFPTEVAALFRANDTKVIEAKMPMEFEENAIQEDGVHHYISIKVPLIDASGAPFATCGISTDISERKRMEEALRESEEKYRSVISNIPDVTWTSDGEGNTIFISSNVTKIFGYTPDEIYASEKKAWLSAIHPDDLHRVVSSYNALFADNEHYNVEYRLKRKDGSWIWINDRAMTCYEKNGVKYADGIFSDITERKIAEEKIARLNRLYSVLSKINEAIVRNRDTHELCQQACHVAVEDGGFLMSWIGFVNRTTMTVEPFASWGEDVSYLDNLNISLKDEPEGRGMTGKAIREGKPFICNDVEKDPCMALWREKALKYGFRSSAAIPLRSKGMVLGALNFYSGEANFFNNEEMKLIEALAADISYAIEAIEFEKEGKRAQEELNLLQTVSLDIREAEDIHSALKLAITKICHTAGWSLGEVWIPNQDGTALEYAAVSCEVCGKEMNELVEASKRISFSISEGLPGRVWAKKENLWIKDISRENDCVRAALIRKAGLKAAFGIPIISGDRVLAILVFFMKEVKGEDQRSIDLVSAISAQLGSVIQRKFAEEARQELQQRYEELVNRLRIGIYRNTAGEEGRFLEVNPAVVSIVEADSKEEVLKHNVSDFYADKSKRLEFSNKLLKFGFIRNEELEFITLKNRKIWVAVSAMKKEKDGGIYFDGVIEDITEHKRLEEQLRQAQKIEAVGQLAGGIAHDFNNILTALIGYGNLLMLKKSDDELVKTYAGQMLNLSEKAATLTQGLLAFSRKQIMNPKAVDLNDLVKRVEKILLRIIGEDIQLKAIIDDKELIIKADSTQIEQVIINIATNARDAMPGGGSLIIKTETLQIDKHFIEKHGYGEPGSYGCITISDTGTGIEASVQERIFEPFFTTKEVGKGTGLGLSVVYGIVKQHYGFINVYSEPGKGTTFRIYLPLSDSYVAQSMEKEHEQLRGGKEIILLAEDEADVRNITRAMLQEFGYTVIEAVDGEDAVAKFIENQDSINMLLFDMIMPKKNGKEAYAEIVKIKPQVKALFTSGYAAEIMRTRGILDEGLNFISKPVSPGDFLNKVREVLDHE